MMLLILIAVPYGPIVMGIEKNHMFVSFQTLALVIVHCLRKNMFTSDYFHLKYYNI